MKNQRGITVLEIILYVIVATVISGILFVNNTNVHNRIISDLNISYVYRDYSKILMYLVSDFKNSNVCDASSNLEYFDNGSSYNLVNGALYRNNIQIADNVSSFVFYKQPIYEEISQYAVKITVKNNNKEISKLFNFTLGRGY